VRTVLEVIAIAACAALSLWAGLPWPIVFVVAVLLACGLRLFSFTKSDRLDPGLFFALAAFLALGLLMSWLLEYTVFSSSAGETAFGAIGGVSQPGFSRTLESLVFGFVLAALFCVPLLLPLSFISARIVYGSYDQYKGNELQAMFSLIRSVLGMSKGTLLVKAGAVQVINGKEERLKRFGGPATLIVQEGHAVILEKSGALSRIVGRGTRRLLKFERVGAVVELTPKSQALEEANVVARDGVCLDTVQALVFYRVVPGDPHRPGFQENGKYPFNDDVVYRFWTTTGEQTWQGAVRSISKAALRDVIARVTLDQIFTDPDTFRKRMKGDKEMGPAAAAFSGELCDYINKITEPLLGVRITAADIGDIRLPTEAKQRLVDKWMATAELQAAIIRGQAEAVALTTQEKARAKAQSRMIKQISQAIKDACAEGAQGKDETVGLDQVIEQVVRLRMIEALEKMAAERSPGIFMPNELLAWLGPGRATKREVDGNREADRTEVSGSSSRERVSPDANQPS
jgi:regulator of protease activity HflC (stomatin/prohibitin superfamily)